MTVARSSKNLQCDHGQRRQAIVQSVLTEVFQSRLRAGQRLTTQKLAERFGVSHTPIREALIELAGIGIIDLLPNRGAVVRRVSVKDVREVYQVRRVLECAAVRSACGRINRRKLQSMSDEIEQLLAETAPNSARYIQQARDLDSRLHDLISSSCGNTFLGKELGRLKTLFRAFRDVAWEHDQAWNDYRRVTEEAREHLAIVEALLAGDGKEAARAMSRHILSGGKYWSNALRNSHPDAETAR